MRRKITNEIWMQVETAYASGIGLREIARNMNLPAGTMLSRAKREGWTREIQSAKAPAKREDVFAVIPVEAAADDTGTRAALPGAAWRASQSVQSITSKQWTARKSSTRSIKSTGSTRLHAGLTA
jgi:hypothetical protein